MIRIEAKQAALEITVIDLAWAGHLVRNAKTVS